jgi:hypothetical protein
MFRIRSCQVSYLSLSCAAAIAVCLSGPANASVSGNLIANPGFETVEPVGSGYPSTYADWNGNYASFHTAENGITPHVGTRMLRIDGTQSVGDGTGSSLGGDVYQIVDVSGFASQIATGRVTVSASVFFNRIAGDAQTDTQFSISVYAYAGNVANFPSEVFFGALISQNNYLLSDANPVT